MVDSNHSEEKKWIDISNNPARITSTDHFSYCGASKMWFGPEFFKNFPKEKLLAFDQAVEIKELKDGIVFVHLYEGIFDGAKKENQQVQHDFRKLLNIDQLDVKTNS